MSQVIEAIVLKSFDYRDHHKIAKVLSPTVGLISVYMANASRTKSKVRALGEPMNVMNLNVKPPQHDVEGLYYLYAGEITQYFLTLKSDYDNIMNFYLMAEIVLKSGFEPRYAGYVYKLFKSVLDLAETGTEMKFLVMVFKLKMLPVLGIQPVVDCCVNCGSRMSIICLSVNSGGLLCSNCLSWDEQILIDSSLVNVIRGLLKAPIDELASVEIGSEVLGVLETFTDAYYDNHSGLALKGSAFLK